MLIEKSTKFKTRFLIRLEKDWTDLNVKVNFQERLFALNIKVPKNSTSKFCPILFFFTKLSDLQKCQLF